MKKIYIALLIALFLVSNIIALTCDKSNINLAYNKSNIPSSDIQLTNCNGNANEIFLSQTNPYLSLVDTSISGQKFIKMRMSNNIEKGNYVNLLSFKDNGTLLLSIPVIIDIKEEQPPKESPECNIDIFPTILTNIKIQQGEKKTRNIQMSVPKCHVPININGVALQTDERPIQLGELSIGKIQPGNSVIIPLDLNAEGISTGQYSDTLQLLLYNESGSKINVPSVSISVLVSQGIQPITNFSLSDLPTCSLDAIEMNLNNSYKMTCSLPNPNIEIRPLVNSKFIKGISVDETSSQYIYTFKPILIGESSIGAEFLYKMAPLGIPFNQEIRISPSGNSPISGITMKALFYQDNKKTNVNELKYGTTKIIIVDNKTESIITSSKLILNGNNINDSFELSSQEEYELRISSAGFLDLVINFEVNQTPIVFYIIPEKSIYYVGDAISFNYSVNGTKFLINGLVSGNPYIIPSKGNYTIQAVKEGYISSEKNIFAEDVITYVSMTPLFDEWKKGSKVFIELSKNASWEVLKNNFKISSGEGKLVEFKIEDYGNWEVRSGERGIVSKSVEKGFIWYNPLTWQWVIGLGLWWIPIIVVLFIFGYFFYSKQENKSVTPYS